MMNRTPISLLLLVALASTALAQSDTAMIVGESTDVVYRVRQTVTLDRIDTDADRVCWWISIPSDDRDQEVLDLEVVSAPGSWKIVKDARGTSRFLYVEARKPGHSKLDVVADVVLRRKSVFVGVNPELSGPLSQANGKAFAEYLRRDSRHMEVTPAIQKMADQVCGRETSLAVQAEMLLNHVADLVDHYSKDPSKPSCGVGDAGNCIAAGGGCCTDLHSLFIALARARGIPARLQMGYRLLERNEGRDVDPGYRCWAEYFVPGYGWVPADIVEADAPQGFGRMRWFTGLTARRLWLNEGRDFELGQKAAPVNHMSIGYAEIDGRPASVLPEGDTPAQLTRKIHFDTIAAGEAAVLASRR